MCGITGFLTSDQAGSHAERLQIVERMATTLAHRGPDDAGAWADDRVPVALGHRRLSILDLSAAGHQPMNSPCGRYTLVYNGEVYNHAELRGELLATGAIFRGHSDTEVLLAAIAAWGVEETARRCNGMFAWAVWDNVQQELWLVRDRLGIKPLYYGLQGKTFLFGSELKALRRHPDFVGEINRDALCLFLWHNYIPAPHSIYRGIYKLPAGSLLRISAKSDLRGELPQPQSYWNFAEMVAAATRNRFTGSPAAAVDELEKLLLNAVALRMEADVPLGAFLSGGVDSTTVVSLMQRQSTRPIRTFSIGFEERAYNEAEYAKAVAQHLGTDHTEYYVTPAEARDVIPRLPILFDEPFADSSQIPTFLVSELARKQVTVSLSGDGGDELFGGYSRYAMMESIWRKIGWCPTSLRRVSAAVLRGTIASRQHGRLRRKAATLSDFLALSDRKDAYCRLNTHWKHPEQVVIDGQLPATILPPPAAWPRRGNFLEEMMFADTLTYLPEDILAKVDRASMGVSLEARVPLLDHRVVEWAWRLPVELRVRDGLRKWPLWQILDRHVPRELTRRPKVGFGVPIDSWLRGPLRDWAEDLLGEDRLRRDGFFHPAPIREKWEEHLSGQNDWHYYLWDVLMFQAWWESNEETAA